MSRRKITASRHSFINSLLVWSLISLKIDMISLKIDIAEALDYRN